MNHFKKNEKILLILSSVLFSVALLLTIKSIPLWKIFLIKDWSNFSWNSLLDNQPKPMGVVWEIKSGKLQKKSLDEMVFKEVNLNSSFGYMDTFMTDKYTEAILKMHDGTIIKLSPNSLVQIAFDEGTDNNKIVKRPKLKIFSGVVESPIVIEKKKAVKVTLKEQIKALSPAFKKTAGLDLPRKISSEEIKIKPIVNIPIPNLPPEVKVPSLKPIASVKQKTLPAEINYPEQLPRKEVVKPIEVPKISEFKVKSSISGSEKILDNTLQDVELNNFYVQLDWEDIPQANRYEIQVLNHDDLNKIEQVYESEVSQYRLAKNEVFDGKLYYQVVAYKDRQEISRTKILDKFFKFNAPKLKNPALNKEEEAGTQIIFTWTKTNFTEGYVLELSKNANFAASKQIPVAQNFTRIKLPEGVYYWRVWGKSGKVQSPPSSGSWFSVKKP